MIAQSLGGIGEIVGVHADAVAAHQARLKAQGVPLGVHARQDLIGVDAHAVTDHGHLVHEGDIDIPLTVLHHLHGLGSFDGGHGEGADLDDDVVHLFNFPGGLLIHAGDDLTDVGEGMDPVTGVDALGAIADLPIHTALEAGLLLDNGHADVLGNAGIHRGLKDHDGTGSQILAHSAGGTLHRAQVRGGIGIHGGGNSHYDELGLLQPLGVGGEFHGGVLDGLTHLVGGVDAAGVFVYTFFIDVKADDGDMLSKLHSNGHAHIAQAHQGQLLRALDQAVVNGVEFHITYTPPLRFPLSSDSSCRRRYRWPFPRQSAAVRRTHRPSREFSPGRPASAHDRAHCRPPRRQPR